MANRKNIRRGNWGRIISEGMGGFLKPPTHPELSFSVKSCYGDTFGLSLTGATQSNWLDDECKAKAQKLLDNWIPLSIDDPGIKDWILQVMGYFRHCYNEGDGWNANKLAIYPDINPIVNQNLHAGVHYIREYYPNFILTEDIVDNAYWGKNERG